jgi:hypothetical protein
MEGRLPEASIPGPKLQVSCVRRLEDLSSPRIAKIRPRRARGMALEEGPGSGSERGGAGDDLGIADPGDGREARGWCTSWLLGHRRPFSSSVASFRLACSWQGTMGNPGQLSSIVIQYSLPYLGI